MYYHYGNTGRKGVKTMSKITRKGQVTIPESIRDSFGLLPGCDVEFVIEKGKVVIRREVKKAKIEKWQGVMSLNADVDEFIESLRSSKNKGKKRA
jgi:AbrB family looped-hinge helix DNA binding protein